MALEWKIKYWTDKSGKRPVEVWLDSLNTEELKAVAKELRLLKEIGNQLLLPHSKALKKGLFELRERRYSFRIYYAFYQKQVIVLLTAGNKKTQDSDIKLARIRLQQLLDNS
jgi:putative addiction module killer protein